MENNILKHRMAVMNNIAKSFGYEKSEDLLEKAEDNDIEKAKHQDGDMHPNGKWVWRASANGGKGDWRVAKKGSSSTSGGSGSAGASGGSDSRVSAFMSALKVVNSKFTDESKIKVVKTDKGNWDTTYDGHRVGIIRGSFLSEKVAKEKGWLEEDDNDKIINSQSASAAKAYVKFLDGKNESMSFNDHFAEAIERANGDTNKVLKVFKEHLKKHLMSAGVAPENVDDYYKQFQGDLDKTAIKNYLKKKGIEWNWTKEGDTKKSSNTVTHDINGTKVTVTKNSDGSYTLEANGKKVKSDDPSFFVNGTNLKPRVKAALAKEVGLKQKNGKEIPNTMVEIHKDLDKKYEDEIKPFTYTSNGVSDLKKQGKTGYALWVGFEHSVRGRQPVDRTKMKNFVQNTAIKHLLKEVNERTGKKISEKDVKIDDRWDTTDMFRIYVEV